MLRELTNNTPSPHGFAGGEGRGEGDERSRRDLTIRRAALVAFIFAAVILSPGHTPEAAAQQAGGQRPALNRDNGAPRERAAVPNRVAPAGAAVPAGVPAAPDVAPPGIPGFDVDQMTSPGGLSSTLRLMMLFTVLSLAPSILIMTTCFIRFVIVIGLLRQALGIQQMPPNQVVVSLCLFLTFFVMSPVWTESYEKGIKPYTQEMPIPGQQRGEDRLTAAGRNAVQPMRRFMADQIEMTGNTDGIWMLLELQRANSPNGELEPEPETYDEVPLSVLLPAFMLSELKTAFVIGFQIFLPFLILDMVVASVLTSMGMMMLPPVLISNPLKLLLFILIDGWTLTVGMMLSSVRPFG